MQINLFQPVDPLVLIEENVGPYLDPSWMSFIGAGGCYAASQAIAEARYDISKGINVYPSMNLMFRAYNMVKPQDVNVVILSQCPYPDHNADGLAFSCGSYLSQSLRQIYTMLSGDPTIMECEFIQYPIALDHWAKKGVLLINCRLLVQEGDPRSYKDSGHWTAFTRYVCSALTRMRPEVPIMLLGEEAKDMRKHLSKSTFIGECEHPANASRNQSYWDCQLFNAVNTILVQQGKPPIDWLEIR
jgi:uracil-DNA glycosylase